MRIVGFIADSSNLEFNIPGSINEFENYETFLTR